MCPVLGSGLAPSGIHRTSRIVAGPASCSAALPRKSKHGHTWPPPRARVDTVQNRPEPWAGLRYELTFRLAQTRHAPVRSSGSEGLSRIRALAGHTIDIHGA